MQTHLSEAAGTWDSESGAFISESHRHLAEILHDYNPYFSLVWIPPKDRDATDVKPFAILSDEPGKPKHIIRYLSETEMLNPQAIMGWIFEGDLSKHRAVDIFSKIEAREKAEELFRLKKKEDELEDIMEFGSFVGRTRLNTFRHNGKVYRE
jgi:hypothetical protein